VTNSKKKEKKKRKRKKKACRVTTRDRVKKPV